MNKKKWLHLIISVTLVIISLNLFAQDSPRSRESFNEGWKFVKFFNASYENNGTDREPEGLQSHLLDDSSWRSIDLPHDWAIEGPFSDTLENNTGLLPWKGVGWYRKHFNVEAQEKEKRIYIEFDGAMAYSQVWLNGKYVGGWPYGYSSFRLDLTPFINFGGENIIAVRLDTKKWDSRWYPGAGIYRNVWLVKTSQVHVAFNGLYCTTPAVSKEKATVSVSAEIENHLSVPVAVKVRAAIYKTDRNLKKNAAPAAVSREVLVEIQGSEDHKLRLDLNVPEPVLWDIEDPELYCVVLTVSNQENLTDMCETTMGFRTLEFTARDGFFLNGRRVEIRGVCNHHDLGALGSAINTRALERQLEILKEMGCNAVRTSHNPPAPELLDLCDRMFSCSG